MNDSPQETQSTPANSRPRRRWLWAFVVTTLLVGAGTVFGAVLAVGFMHHAGYHGPGGPTGPDPERMASILERRLDLTPDQREQVYNIFAQQHEQLHAIRSETAPRVMGVLDETQQAVAEVLNPEQAQRWNEHFSRLRSRHQPANWKDHRRYGGDRNRRPVSGMTAAMAQPESRPILPANTDTRIFERADANNDGAIDSNEWNRLVARLLRAELQREAAPEPETGGESESL